MANPGRGGIAAAALAAAGRGQSRGIRLAAPVGFGAWLAEAVEQELDNRRLFPWLAVASGLGILAAFAADGPLSIWPPLTLGAVLATGALAARRHYGAMVTLVALAAVSFGFAAAVVRMRTVAAPVLARLTTAKLEGFVESTESRSRDAARVVIRTSRLGEGGGAKPQRVRVSVRTLGAISPGDYVAGSARLLPPPEAARPGGYDFARDAYFRGLGAVGSISGRLQVRDPPTPPDASLRVAATIDRARNAMTARIAEAIGGQAGAVSAALITGKRGLIDDHTNDILRAAGIYHVVSISGLHMVLAAGVFFWFTRAALALVPALALGWPIKKIAALVGMAGATGYCVFSGLDVAAERSLLMILVMQGAILVDRPALSLRNLALSALLVLAREPEAVLGPSFQMSYAAVAGLIAYAEWERRLRPAAEAGDPWRRAWLWLRGTVVGVVGTTAVATLATGPFSTFHFQNLQPYGIIGNAATLPLISFAIMPAAVIGTLVLPFGLDRPVWIVMGWATEGVLRLSEWVASFPVSTLIVPAFGAGALACMVVAVLLVTLLSSELRRLAVIPAACGLALSATASRPDIYVARDGAGAAVRGAGGRLILVGRPAAFTAEQWLRADGDSRRPTDPSLIEGRACDRIGCIVRLGDGRAVSYLADWRGFSTDCSRADVVLSRFAAPPGCEAELVVDRRFLSDYGAVAIRALPVDPYRPGFDLDTTRDPDRQPAWRPPKPQPTAPRIAARPEPPPAPEPAEDGGLPADPTDATSD